MLVPFKLMLDLVHPVRSLDTMVIKMLTAADSISVGVCVHPVLFICSVGLVENFFGKLGLKREFSRLLLPPLRHQPPHKQ